MLIDENGLKIDKFEPAIAEVLGSTKGEEGGQILNEAILNRHQVVELRDWLYCLAKASGTMVRRFLIDNKGLMPDRFVRAVENNYDTKARVQGLPPIRVTSGTIAPAVTAMLQNAEAMAEKNQARISDAILTQAFIETADEDLRDMLVAWASPEGWKLFCARVKEAAFPVPPGKAFRTDGTLDLKLFASSARKLFNRIREDVQSLGAKKATTRHLLYSLLGNENSLLTLALTNMGIDVKKELHSRLARELAKAGSKRTEEFELRQDTVFDAVRQLIEEAVRQARLGGRSTVTEFDISRVFAVKQGGELARLNSQGKPIEAASVVAYVNAAEFSEEEEEKPLHRFTVREIQEKINERIRGQEEAVARVIPWIKRLRFGIPRNERPAAVFLFLGPTGCGKTQLAKELARYVFGSDDNMIFLEMGQYKSKESMSMFIGAPPGYVGYGDGKLTNGLRDKPESVVLFDEIEKADTQVFDTLLRFADEGLITDPAGPIRDGRKCIIVMTTNAGQQWLRDELIKNPGLQKDPVQVTKGLFNAAMEELRKRGFRPEFLGRVDERIVFLPFSLETCRRILDQVLDQELEKFRKLKGIEIEVPDEVRKRLTQKVFERTADEGARGAPRTINEEIVSPAIDKISDAEEGGEPLKKMIASVQGLTGVTLEVVE